MATKKILSSNVPAIKFTKREQSKTQTRLCVSCQLQVHCGSCVCCSSHSVLVQSGSRFSVVEIPFDGSPYAAPEVYSEWGEYALEAPNA